MKLSFTFAEQACAVCVLCAATASAVPAQTFSTVFRFDQTDGGLPQAALVQGIRGDLYGTTTEGGAYGDFGGLGAIFSVAPDGTVTTLYSFCAQSNCTDGTTPAAPLVQGADGDLYGTTEYGGSGGGFGGTVFKITTGGSLTTLHSFCAQSGCPDGEVPRAPLVQATSGDFYGTTSEGGAHGGGTIFKITSSGVLTTIYNFSAQSGAPSAGGLIQASDGDLYGTTVTFGAHDAGTVFKISVGGSLTTLYSFCAQSGCTDGQAPQAGLVQATNGELYGTTYYGGANGSGTVFKITPSGTLTTLYSFCAKSGCADGANPLAGLIQGTDGNLYGTTDHGGAPGAVSSNHGRGTVFRMTPDGALTTLYSFCAQSECADGSFPEAALAQMTNGALYGTTYSGGLEPTGSGESFGTVFSLSLGLGPFVETVPASGKAGTTVQILGTNLTGATSVTFNGAAAAFAVNDAGCAILTTVPAGAISGTVEVATPGGTLLSNVAFRVLP